MEHPQIIQFQILANFLVHLCQMHNVKQEYFFLSQFLTPVLH